MINSDAQIPFRLTDGVAYLRYNRAGLQHSEGSDWDLAVIDTAASRAQLIAELGGEPDILVRRTYVEQHFFKWGQVDFLPCFAWNGIEYLDVMRFWERVTRDENDGLPRPCLAHDAVICWLGQLLSGASYRAKYDTLLNEAWEADEDEVRECLKWAFGKAWAQRLAEYWQDGNYAGAIADVPQMRNRLKWEGLKRDGAGSWLERYRHWKTEFYHHRRPPFPWIAFLGPDGSGKSSVISGIEKRLNDRRLKSHMFHWRPKLLWPAQAVEGGVVTDPHAKPPRGKLVSLLKLGALLGDWILGDIWVNRHPRAKDRLVFSDRFYADMLIDSRRYRFGLPKSIARKFFCLFPRPDKVIVLAGDADTIYKRKKEVPLEEVHRQVNAYQDFAESSCYETALVDAAMPLEQVLDQVESEIFEKAREVSANNNERLLLPHREPIRFVKSTDEAETPAPVARPLRVLFSAYSCNPNRGGEAAVGWGLSREMSQRHKLSVVTRSTNREAIKASSEDWVRQVDWIYHDPPRWATFWRTERFGVRPFYAIWQLTVRKVVVNYLADHDVDLIHHITFGAYLMPSPLSDLGVPLVFGPVGGGDETPQSLKGIYGLAGSISEAFRRGVRFVGERLPIFGYWLRLNAWNLAATPRTRERLENMGVTRISSMLQSGIDQGILDEFAEVGKGAPADQSGTLHFVTASRLVHWKAVNLAIEGVARARSEGLAVRLTVLHEGPEEQKLREHADELAIADCIDFKGRLDTREEVFQMIASADALLHPALHEAFGQVVLESLALGTPVVSLAWGGPGMIVDESCGYRIKPDSHSQTVDGISAALHNLAAKKAGGYDWRPAARRRAADFSWAGYAERLDSLYEEVLNRR